MTRLLHFTEGGDTSGYFVNLARWHDRSRYQVLFGALKRNPTALEDQMGALGVRCFNAGAKTRASYPLALLRLARFLSRERIDIVHTHLFEPSVIGLLAAWLAGTKIRVQTRHYSDYHTRIARPWHVRLDQLCTRLAHRVIGVSQHTVAHLVDVEGTPPGKVVAIPNGVDFDRLRPCASEARLRLRQEFNAESAHLIIVPARLHPEKGHAVLFDALPQLRATIERDFVVVLAGSGPFEGTYRARLAALGCADLVRFAGFRADLPDLLQAADLVVLPSLAEAFGFVLVEAMYLGAPIVATTAGGIPEIVDDGVNGLVVRPGDPDALAGAMARVLTDKGLNNRLRSAGPVKALEYGVEKMVRRYEQVYADLQTEER